MDNRFETRAARGLVPAVACLLILVLAALTLAPAPASADFDVPASLEKQAKREGTVKVFVTLKAPAASRQVLLDDELWAEYRAERRAEIREVLNEVPDSEIELLERYEGTGQIFVETTEEGLAALADIADVKRIDELTWDEPLLHESTLNIQSQAFNQTGYTGNGYKIAVLDTGVRPDHALFGNRVEEGNCYTNAEGNGDPGTSQNSCPNGSHQQIGDDAGDHCDSFLEISINGCDHGTHVAAIAAGGVATISGSGETISGVAPAAKIVPYQVFTRFTPAACSPSAPNPTQPCVRSYNIDQQRALEDIRARVQNGEPIAAVNMSLGGAEHLSPCGSDPRALAINQLRALGVAVVIASGNDDSRTFINSPGCIPNAITVGSVGKNASGANVSSFSNHSPLVDVMAPGSGAGSTTGTGGILSAVTQSTTALQAKSGTSMATPHVAGAFTALRQRFPSASVSLIEDAFKNTGPTASAGCATKHVLRVQDAANWIVANPGGAPAPSDTTAPIVTRTLDPASPGAGGTYTTGQVTVNLQATDAGSGVRCIQWRSGTEGAVSNVIGTSHAIVASNGSSTAQQFTYQYRAIDEDGNTSNFQTVTFNVRDGVAPVTTHSLNPATPNGSNGWYTGTPPTVTLSATDNFAQPADLVTEYRFGTSGGFTQYSGPFQLPANNPSVTVQYRSVDDGPNTESLKQFTVKTDSVAPVTTATSTASQVTHPETIGVTLSASDATSGVASTTYCVTTATNCTPQTAYNGEIDIAGIGVHTVFFRSVDQAGNVENTKSVTVTVHDPVPPVSTHQLNPATPNGAAGWYRTAPQITLSATDNLTPANEIEIGFRFGNSGPFSTYIAPFPVNSQGSGQVIQYRAIDGDGNVEETKSFTVDVDTTAPVTVATGEPPSIAFPGTITVSLNVIDQTSGAAGAFYCVTSGVTCTPSTPYTEPFVLSGMGTHIVRYRGIDVAGNLETVKQSSFEVQSVPLSATFTDAPTNAKLGDTFSVAAEILGGNPAQITASGACVTVGGELSPVTVKAVGAGVCVLVAGGPGVSITDTAEIGIARAKPSMKLKAKPKKVRRGKKVTLVATVKSPAGTTADGKVAFRVGKRKLARKLRPNGTVKVKVKVKGKPGRKVKVVARFEGSANLRPGPAVRTTIRIR